MKLTDRIEYPAASIEHLIHIVVPSDISQDAAGSSFKIPLEKVIALSPGTIGGTVYGNVIYFDTVLQLSAYTVDLSSIISTISGGSSNVIFTNPDPTPTTVGGIAAGSTFSAQTFEQMFNALLYPYQPPAFSSFSLQGISSPQEIGFDIATSETFTWGISHTENLNDGTIQIAGYNMTTLSGLLNDGSQPVTFSSPVTRGSADGPGTRDWTIQATNTHSANFTGNLSIRWDYKMYAGGSSNVILTGPQIQALTDFSSVKNGFSGSFPMAAGGFKYFCFANTYGTPTSFKDASNGNNIAMTTDSVNYPNTDGNGVRYALVSVTNANSETTNYRVYRTLNQLGGTITIIIA